MTDPLVPDHRAVRLVRVPSSTHGAGLTAVLAPSLGDGEAAHLALAIRGTVNAERGAPGWAVVWGAPALVGRDPSSGRAAVRLTVTGDDGGERVAGRLRRALGGLRGVVSVDTLTSEAATAGVPLVARWGAWTAGPVIGGVRAVLVPGAVEAPLVELAPPVPRAMCPRCGTFASPIRLTPAGLLADDGADALAVALGEARFGDGCQPTGFPPWQCPRCAARFLPGSEPPAAVHALLGAPGAPAGRTRTVAVLPDRRAVWSPAVGRTGDHWWTALNPGAAAVLWGAPDALAALRLAGAATVFVRWRDLATLAAGHAGRVHLAVRVGDLGCVHGPGGQATRGAFSLPPGWGPFG